MNILLNLNEVLALCLHKLASLVDDDVLFLVLLTTTHVEAGLPTSTAQHGGLREVGTRVGSLGLRSGDPFPTKHACGTGALYLLGMMSLGRTTLKFALSQAPEHVEGEEQEKIVTLRFCNPRVGFTQAPEHVEGEGL
jgi:hypothetical protein